MKMYVSIVLIFLLLGGGGHIAVAKARRTPVAEQSMYAELRDRALRTTASDLGLKSMTNTTTVYGVVLEMGLSEGTATLVAFKTGDVSLYLSTGGGVIGGVGQSQVRKGAAEWINVTQDHLSSFSATTAYPLPTDGRARFYVLTAGGVLTAEVSSEQVNSGELPLSPVWYVGQRLLTDLHHSSNSVPD